VIADEFDKRIDAIAKQKDMIIRKSALDMFSEIIMRTPVDQGIAKGSWQTEIDNIPTGYDLSIRDKSGASARNKALKAMLKPKTWKDYTIYFVNNLPYIRRLEYGWSTVQAPQGMVRLTVTKFNKFFTEAVKSGK